MAFRYHALAWCAKRECRLQANLHGIFCPFAAAFAGSCDEISPGNIDFTGFSVRHGICWNSCEAAHARRREYGHVSGFGRRGVDGARSLVVTDVIEIVFEDDDRDYAKRESFQRGVEYVSFRDIFDCLELGTERSVVVRYMECAARGAIANGGEWFRILAIGCDEGSVLAD